MRRIKFDRFSPEALEIFQVFKSRPGSDHIAKPVTIEALLRLLQELRPERVLEMGGGIGAISYTVLKHSAACLDVYEDDLFCREQLLKALSDFKGRYQILTDYRVLPSEREYDLVIVDGGSGRKGDGGFREAVCLYLDYLQNLKAVYVEGNRHNQRVLARRSLRKRYLYRLTAFADAELDGELMHGGLLISVRKSGSILRRFLNFIYWELLEWKGVRNALLYRLQKAGKWFRIK